MVDKEFEGEMAVIVITDDEGNETFYEEEVIIPYNGKEFGILVSLPSEESIDGEHNPEEGEIIIAKIEEEDGESIYVAPDDEEFEAVLHLYETLGEE